VFFSAQVDETAPLIFSHLNISFDFMFSSPFDLNPERLSRQWPSSNEMNSSLVDTLHSDAFEITEGFFSNLYLKSHSYLFSNLFPTVYFLGKGDNDEKDSLESVRITSGAAAGGAGFVALAVMFCFGLVLYRRHTIAQNNNEINQIIDEFDLSTEHWDEEELEDEEEHVFDIEDDNDRTNSDDLLGCDHWECGLIRGEDE
jgi:hypothetical protein